jgi:hypothetical protein
MGRSGLSLPKHSITAIVLMGVGIILFLHALKHSKENAAAPQEGLAGGRNQPGPPASAGEALEGDLIQADANQKGDSTLGKEYQEINEGHFGGKLPAIPVLWEPRLKIIGPQIAEGFNEKGLWGHYGSATIILLNPDIRGNPAEVRRTLCHEMVHEYLFTIGDSGPKHGPVFQNELQRLLTEGAFEAISASADERADLRSRLLAEAKRLDWEKSDLDATVESVTREGSQLNQQISELNERVSNANKQGSGWPSQEEMSAAQTRREDFKRRVTDLDFRVQQHNTYVAAFNQQVSRYNLMVSYPDGLDEESAIPSKPAAAQYPSRP